MSLKYFHLVFLAIATLADAAFWAWLHFMPEDAIAAGTLYLKPYAGWLCILLLAYGAHYATQKMRHIIV
jgi:hypothetical protein